MTWRCYAQRVLTDEWLHRDLPLADIKITPVLSGPYRISATIDPVYADLVADDGELLLSPWKTWVWVEASDLLRGGGLVTDTTQVGQTLSVEITGITGYLTSQPIVNNQRWGGKTEGQTGNGVDPLDVYRALWDWLQSQASGDLGVTVDSTTSPYRLGEWHNARALDTDGSLGDDPKAVNSTPIPIDKVWDPKKDKPPIPASGKSTYWQYQLNWWDNLEVGRTVDELARQVPFDYREQYSWATPAKEAVVRHVQLGYPRVGKRQTNLRFAEGENVTELVAVHRSGDDFTNAVTVYGAGEGSKKKRGYTSIQDGRVRRAKTLERPDITSVASLKALAEDELRRYNTLDDVTSFTVADHPNARLGTFDVGDDVLVEGYTGWSPVRMWVRITSMTLTPDAGAVTVTCSRSDRFRYGGPT